MLAGHTTLKWLSTFFVTGIVLVQSGRKVPEADVLRGYAFASCLAEAYKGTPFANDAERVAALYMEVGKTTDKAVYENLQQLARSTEPGNPDQVDGANLGIMSCLEFYEGADLRRTVKQATRARGGSPSR